MKIAVIGSKGLPAHQGGVEHHCKELYSRVVQSGHSVDLFARCSYTDAKPLVPYYANGVRVIPLPSPNFRGLDALVNAALGAVAASNQRYDIVHFHAIGPSLFCWVPRLLSSAKVVVTCHGLDWARSKWGMLSGLLLRKGEEAAVYFSNALISVSRDLQTYFQKTYGIESAYIPNAPAHYPQSDPNFSLVKSFNLQQERYILFVGRLVPEKRPDLLLQAFQALKPQGWKLVFVGDASDTSAFKATLDQQAAADSTILLTGALRGAKLAEIVRGAGLFVLPSDLEGLPLVMLEAMKEGIPVLASNIAIHQSLLSDGRGLLFQASSLEDCIQQLEWAVKHQPEMQQMAIQAQQYVQAHYNWDHIATETLILYTKLQARLPKKFSTLSQILSSSWVLPSTDQVQEAD